MKSRNRQSGVAIITAILITTLAAVAAYALTTELQLDIRRSSNLLDTDQALLFVKGAEAWTRTILTVDRELTESDHYAEPWALGLPPIELEGGTITGAMEDMQGRFNLNSLAGSENEGATGADAAGGNRTVPGAAGRGGAAPVPEGAGSAARERFERLLSLLELDPALAQALTDWVDENLDPLPPSGAEDEYYLGLTPPYRTANRPMVSVSELRLVKGFTDEVYYKIAPFVSALPGDTAINVNTAPLEVLACLHPEFSLNLAERLVQRRDAQPYESLNDFTGDSLLKGIAFNPQGIDVHTEYVMLRTEARIGSGRIRMSSLFSRSGDEEVRVIERSPGQE